MSFSMTIVDSGSELPVVREASGEGFALVTSHQQGVLPADPEMACSNFVLQERRRKVDFEALSGVAGVHRIEICRVFRDLDFLFWRAGKVTVHLYFLSQETTYSSLWSE